MLLPARWLLLVSEFKDHVLPNQVCFVCHIIYQSCFVKEEVYSHVVRGVEWESCFQICPPGYSLGGTDGLKKPVVRGMER